MKFVRLVLHSDRVFDLYEVMIVNISYEIAETKNG